MSRTQVRKKGFSFLSFFLGFLFAIIVIVGSIAGVIIFALNTDLDTLLSTFGVDNSKDEEGNNKVVNTDPENGGVTSVLQLITAVSALATDYENKTIGDVEALLPVAAGLVDTVYDMVNQYVSVDKEEIKAVKFSEFGSYLTEVVYEIEPASFFDTSSSPLIDALLRGVDAEYVDVSGTKYPVWYDDDSTYFYCAGENYFVVTESEGSYTATETSYTYNEETAHCTGNFYYENADTSGERITVSPITIGSFVNGGDFLEPLNKIKVVDFMGGGDDGLVSKVLGDISVGDLIGGNVDLEEKINGIEICELLDEVNADNAIMAYICYGLTGVELASGAAYNYIAEVDETTVYVTTDGDGIITGVYSDTSLSDESKVAGTTVNGISARVDNITKKLTIGDIVKTEGNKILAAIADSTIEGLPTKINKIKLGQILDEEDITEENVLLYKLKDTPITEVGGKINELTVNELFAKYETDDEDNTVPEGMWKFLLWKKEGNTFVEKKKYTLNEIGDLVANVTENMNVATLYELQKAKILNFSEGALDRNVPDGDKLGTYTITGALEALTSITS